MFIFSKRSFFLDKPRKEERVNVAKECGADWSRDHVEKVLGWRLIVQRLGANRPGLILFGASCPDPFFSLTVSSTQFMRNTPYFCSFQISLFGFKSFTIS